MLPKKTKLEQLQHEAICGMLDGFRALGYLNLIEKAGPNRSPKLIRAVTNLEAAARAGGADYDDM